MAKREIKKVRGVFERPKSSGVWWINYYAEGVQHRECIGTRGDAIDAYRDRKATARRGRKLPDLRHGRLTLSSLVDDALEYAKAHNSRYRDYASKASIVCAEFGPRIASSIKPQEIDSWLTRRFKTPATSNRYRAFLSLVWKQAMINGNAESNPARLVRQRKEPPGRVRFLSYEEYDRLYKAIERQCPEHLAEFIVSVHTGMRLSEQYTTSWNQVDLDRRVIELGKTKNFSRRTVHLNADAITAIKSVRSPGRKRTAMVFPNPVKDFVTDRWFHPCLKEAGITAYVWHCNRHTFCSWLAMNGASINEIQVAAGHKTIAMAAKYAHLSPAHNLGVVDRISGAVRNPNKH
ncbi:site-specific integrase [Telmatobacter sp. DSM 110680]|uniref:Site-specific integrase n=1 Tax=Telmatobacter sp. DSM 110680 TaxID=3036704 RepID=A0AAU7DEE3_9BACT